MHLALAERSCRCVVSVPDELRAVQDAEWHLTNEVKDIYPDFVKMAESFSVPAKRVLRPEELRPAIRYLVYKHAAHADMSSSWCLRL